MGAVDDPEDVQADANFDETYAGDVENLGEDAVLEDEGKRTGGKAVDVSAKAGVDEEGQEDDCRYTHCLGIMC